MVSLENKLVLQREEACSIKASALRFRSSFAAHLAVGGHAQHLFNVLPGGEDDFVALDAVFVHIRSLLFSFAAQAAAKGAQVSQLDDGAAGQFIRNQLHQSGEHRHHIGTAHGAHALNLRTQFFNVHAPGVHRTGVEFLLATTGDTRFCFLDHFKFNRHHV